ncbi:MAG: FHA domain-containing protein, partial [Acidobacteria bacterium]|nr:FHA domain-containing protein [Acidobacteriota bacterium]
MPARLLVRTGTHEREILLVGSVEVGRDPTCEISEADPQLSRRHAEFIAARDGARVRDLGSRNGIIVNGASVHEATLRPNDVIQIAGLTITYIEDAKANATARHVALDTDDDLTRVVEPPVDAALDPDKTRLVAPPELRSDAAEWASPLSSRPPQPASAPAPQKKDQAKRRSRLSWAARLQIQILLLVAGVFFATAWPMSWWTGRVLDAVGASRARALTGWLAADASNALRTTADVSGAADRVRREAGVVSAVVMALNGHVLAPASRATESIASIPGMNTAPADIVRLRQSQHGELIETAEPMLKADGSRAAIAWTTFRASVPPAVGSSLVVVGPALFAALIAGLVVAARIRRQTMSGVSSLKEDLELAMAGHLTEVTDPLGAKPVRELSDAVNYLVARLRAGDNNAEGRLQPPPRSVHAPAMTPRVGAAAAPSGPPPLGAARVVANASFRITEASPECADLIGVTPGRLLGEHLVDAI